MQMIDPKANTNLLYVSKFVFEQMQRIPTIDAVPVVRCKDCTQWDEKEQECSVWYGFRENDFCSYAVRKDGESGGQ